MERDGKVFASSFPSLVLQKGDYPALSSKLSFPGKPSCLGKEMSPGKMFSIYKARRAILVLYARNNKDKLLDKCGMPSAL